MVSGGKEKIFDGNGGRNWWMRKKVKEKKKKKRYDWDMCISCKEIY